MKFIVPAIVATLLSIGSVSAQSINLGPGGVSVDPRGPRERVIDRENRRDERDRFERRERRREWRAERRGERERCRTVTTREETRRGTVRRTTRVCD